MRVQCAVEEITLPGDYTDEIDSVEAQCQRCGHETSSYGTSEVSVRRCLALTREECPMEESNYYVEGR
jgi:hypothetical protein